MNTSPSFLSAAAPAALAFCLFAAAPPSAVAQQSAGVIPVANPAVPGAAETPAAVDAAANVENPPPAEKPDPNAPTETEVLATNGARFRLEGAHRGLQRRRARERPALPTGVR